MRKETRARESVDQFRLRVWRLLVSAIFLPFAWVADSIGVQLLPPRRRRILSVLKGLALVAIAISAFGAFDAGMRGVFPKFDNEGIFRQIQSIWTLATAPIVNFEMDRIRWEQIFAVLFGYILLRGGQLGADAKDGRVTWPSQVWRTWRTELPSAVFGNGGTGKTTLIDLLYHNYIQSRFSVLGDKRSEELGGEEMIRKFYEGKVVLGGPATPYVITGGSRKLRVGFGREMVDLPGQAWDISLSEVGQNASDGPPTTAWTPHIEALLNSQKALFVNMMTYGYGAAINRPKIYKKWRDSGGDFRERYLDFVKSREERALNYLVDQIADRVEKNHYKCKTLYFVNFINMAGFWWPEREDVRAYFEARTAWKRLAILAEGRFRLKFFPYVPVSLKFDNFEPPRSECECRPIFEVDPDSRAALQSVTARNLQFTERLLYDEIGAVATEGEH